jgi:toxin YoeB
MEIIYSLRALEDIYHWKKSGNKAVQEKISALIDDILKHPYTGIGKPEALKYELSGSWSRRITLTERLVYSVNIEKNTPEIETLRGHY